MRACKKRGRKVSRVLDIEIRKRRVVVLTLRPIYLRYTKSKTVVGLQIRSGYSCKKALCSYREDTWVVESTFSDFIYVR
jgi:hypothetical protein